MEALTRQDQTADPSPEVSAKLRALATELTSATRSKAVSALNPSPGTPIARSEIIVLPKLSKVEYDMGRLRVDYAEIRRLYAEGGEDQSRIMESHLRQVAGRDAAKRLFGVERVLDYADQYAIPTNTRAIIALGGDNHFQRVARLFPELIIVGINSDPERSFGALLTANIDDLPRVLDRLESGKFEIENWTRLGLTVNGQGYDPALCEIFLGERDRVQMSRQLVSLVDKAGEVLAGPIEQKGSGILISTGAGSTGWLQSAARFVPGGLKPFARDAMQAQYLLTEPSPTVVAQSGSLEQRRRLELGILLPGQSLVVQSLNDSDGQISTDSLAMIPFGRGNKAEVTLDGKPLQVARLGS